MIMEEESKEGFGAGGQIVAPGRMKFSSKREVHAKAIEFLK